VVKIIYAGIDPDSKGAIAFIIKDIIKIYDRDDVGTRSFLQEIGKNKKFILKVCLEGANVSPQQGVVGAGKQMKNLGFWEGRMDMLDIVPHVVYAVTWRGAVLGSDLPMRPSINGMDRKAAQKVLRKHRGNLKAASIKKAIELYPEIEERYMKAIKTKREGRAEALLIAEYCRRLYTGQLKSSIDDLK
jgi:hypothetical protein